jgi:hypothetical protein
MAINTAEKRKTIAGIYPFLPPSVTPNSAKGKMWRAESGWGYYFAPFLRIIEICGVAVSKIHL